MNGYISVEYISNVNVFLALHCSCKYMMSFISVLIMTGSCSCTITLQLIFLCPPLSTHQIYIYSYHKVGTNEDINTIVTPTAPAAINTGPITRARARQLNYQVLSFLGNDSNVHENMMLPKLDTFVLLTNEGPSLEKDEHWSKNKNGVTSDDFRTLKPP